MKITAKHIGYCCLLSGLLLAFWFLFFDKHFSGDIFSPDATQFKDIQLFMTGIVAPLLTLGSTLLIIENLRVSSFQNFSTNFFKLIDQHHKLVDNILSNVEGISTEEKPCKGRALFDELASRIAHDYYCIIQDNNPDYDVAEIKEKLIDEGVSKCDKLLVIKTIYDFYFHIHQSDIGHYMRNLYYLVKYVDDSSLKAKQKSMFLSMLRAQLSNYELLLLAYNGLHPYGTNFFPLIEKYELIRSLNDEKRLSKSREKRIVDLEILQQSYQCLKNSEKFKSNKS